MLFDDKQFFNVQFSNVQVQVGGLPVYKPKVFKYSPVCVHFCGVSFVLRLTEFICGTHNLGTQPRLYTLVSGINVALCLFLVYKSINRPLYTSSFFKPRITHCNLRSNGCSIRK